MILSSNSYQSLNSSSFESFFSSDARLVLRKILRGDALALCVAVVCEVGGGIVGYDSQKRFIQSLLSPCCASLHSKLESLNQLTGDVRVVLPRPRSSVDLARGADCNGGNIFVKLPRFPLRLLWRSRNLLLDNAKRQGD